jgi:hypothetical protein
MSPPKKTPDSRCQYDNHHQPHENREHAQPAPRLAAGSSRTLHGFRRRSIDIDNYALPHWSDPR